MRDTGTNERTDHLTGRIKAVEWRIDPLECVGGGSIEVDRVSIVRIACVAAETGARMQRDGLAMDPLDWMITPVKLFGGLPPIEACMDRDACAKAVLLHGLGLDPASEPDVLEQLINEDECHPQEVGHG
ncbi:MAG: hypothetical protein V2I43_28375 [Parvularcula sp.]|jgi:hypothetical protein|nr:hypothetical protein [Parvularcula sp.]